jgi:hypothetical protein
MGFGELSYASILFFWALFFAVFTSSSSGAAVVNVDLFNPSVPVSDTWSYQYASLHDPIQFPTSPVYHFESAQTVNFGRATIYPSFTGDGRYGQLILGYIQPSITVSYDSAVVPWMPTNFAWYYSCSYWQEDCSSPPPPPTVDPLVVDPIFTIAARKTFQIAFGGP